VYDIVEMSPYGCVASKMQQFSPREALFKVQTCFYVNVALTRTWNKSSGFKRVRSESVLVPTVRTEQTVQATVLKHWTDWKEFVSPSCSMELPFR
jgi:hypothetical protein